MEEGFALHLGRDRRGHDAAEQLARRLHGTFGPAVLLTLEAAHVARKLRRSRHVGRIDERPAAELCPVAQVHVLRDRVVLPSPRIIDSGSPPHAGCPVEVEEATGAVARGVLDHEVPIEQHGLAPRQQRVLAVQVAPARLDHADRRVCKEVDQISDRASMGYEVGVEHQHEITSGSSQAVFEGARFVAFAARTPDVLDVHPARP